MIAQFAWAQNTVEFKKWSISNVHHLNTPAFADVENIDGDTFKQSSLLTTTLFDMNNPRLNWISIDVPMDSLISKKNNENGLFILQSYLSVNSWTKGTLNITLNSIYEVYIDNKLVKTKSSSDFTANKIDLELNSGNHKIAIKCISGKEDLKLAASFEYKDDFKDCNATASLNSKKHFTINDVLEGENVSSASISPSGKYVIINYSETFSGSGKSIKHSVLRDLEKNKNISILRNKNISNLEWLPRTDRLSYSTKVEGKATIYIYDIAKGIEMTIVEGISNLSGISWSPTEDFIIYSDYITADKPGDLKRVYGSNDRLPYFRNRSFLHKIDLETKIASQLTAGNLSSNLHDIKLDGSKILISTSRMDYSEVPFHKQNLYEMDVKTLELKTIWEDKLYDGYCQYSPDGTKLLVQGGPECFGELGVKVSEGRIPNSYDSQLYLYDLTTNKVKAITKDFDPAIGSAYWVNSKEIYVSVGEKDYGNLYKYDLKSKQFSKVTISVEVLNDIDFAYHKAIAVYTGTSISTPNKLYSIDLKKGINTVLSFPEENRFSNIKFGKTEPWNFVNKSGTTIYGRVYYPPFYDASKKYPVIVNYYAGTSPIERSFGGRYPINVWTAGGYIVYVLQPSGATGFGQDFSALHVNGWGFDAIDDIIVGTKEFLKMHTTADAENVGCIGASYGGYTTMLLQTRTDIFKTAISHAGISGLTSYWGEGYWGYTYNTGAAKFSYPWNRKDIFVDNSPIYNADKFQNSILLLHGTADTNVPVGESLQYYTALNLLGKDVEMVLVDDQNHWILDYKKRIDWHYTIMSWFDFKLKNQPQQWDNMYPKKNL
jgi:dipeptidyl aminopeptidase/acylaminoacyl peptidase